MRHTSHSSGRRGALEQRGAPLGRESYTRPPYRRQPLARVRRGGDDGLTVTSLCGTTAEGLQPKLVAASENRNPAGEGAVDANELIKTALPGVIIGCVIYVLGAF